MIEDLIIIIPTHNRQHYLGRVIKYYSEFPCKVYICDSSKEKADIDSCGSIIYRWVPQSNFYGKVLDVLNDTSADFYALSPDDDFLKQETLMECYEVMKKNEEYSMGAGMIVAFNQPFDNSFFYFTVSNKLQGINEKSFDNKMAYAQYFEENYQNILWSLFRKKVIFNAFQCLSTCNFSNGNFIELLLGIESLRAGKVYISCNALNYTEYILGEHWGNTTPSINKYNIKTIPSLKQDVESFKIYFNEDNGFSEKCLNYYLDSSFQPTSKSIKSLIKIIVPGPVMSWLVKLLRKNNESPRLETKQFYDPEMLSRISNAIG